VFIEQNVPADQLPALQAETAARLKEWTAAAKKVQRR
jgi:hypothetical protein